jgi:hypothetical protein
LDRSAGNEGPTYLEIPRTKLLLVLEFLHGAAFKYIMNLSGAIHTPPHITRISEVIQPYYWVGFTLTSVDASLTEERELHIEI